MGSSLVKFANRTDGNGRGRIYWGRVEYDGLPFRGLTVPLLTEEEYQQRVVRIADPKNGTFRTWIPEENSAYLDVLDKILNGWAVCLFAERWRANVKDDDKSEQRHIVYIEWAEYYLEDGSRAPVQSLEYMIHGQSNGTTNTFTGTTNKTGKGHGDATT